MIMIMIIIAEIHKVPLQNDQSAVQNDKTDKHKNIHALSNFFKNNYRIRRGEELHRLELAQEKNLFSERFLLENTHLIDEFGNDCGCLMIFCPI